MKPRCIIALLLLAGLCACSRQKTLADRLASADRVVMTNPRDGLTTTITGAQVQKIVQAIKAAKKISSEGLASSPGLRLGFYAGTNHLETVPTSDLIFWIDKTPYEDKSNTLRAYYEKFREEHGSASPP
jgi:hypothetical protein